MAALTTFAQIIRPENLLLVRPVLLVLALVTVNLVYSGQLKVDAAAGDTPHRPGLPGRLSGELPDRPQERLPPPAGGHAGLGHRRRDAHQLPVQDRRRHVLHAGRGRPDGLHRRLLPGRPGGLDRLPSSSRPGGVLKSYGIRWAISLAPAFLLLGLGLGLRHPRRPHARLGPGRRAAATRSSTTPSASPSASSSTSPSRRTSSTRPRSSSTCSSTSSPRASAPGCSCAPADRPQLRLPDRPAPGPWSGRSASWPWSSWSLWLVLTRLVYRRVPGRPQAGDPPAVGRGRDGHRRARRRRPDHEGLQHHPEPGAEHDHLPHEPLRPRQPQRADPRPQGAPGHQAGRDQGPGHGRPARRRRHGLLPRHRGGHRRPRGPPRDRPRLPAAGVPGDHGQAPRRDRRLARPRWTGSRRPRSSAGWSPNPPTLEALGRLLGDPSAEVVLYALESAAVHRRPEHVPLILAQLGQSHDARARPRRPSRPTAPASRTLAQPALRDDGAVPGCPPGRPRGPGPGRHPAGRRHPRRGAGPPPRRAWSRPSSTPSARLRAERPEVRFRQEGRPSRRSSISSGSAATLSSSPPGPPGTAEAHLSLRIKRVFDLLTLLHPAEDIVTAYQNILQGHAQGRSTTPSSTSTRCSTGSSRPCSCRSSRTSRPRSGPRRLRRALRLK
ncbi:MAG: hypothetical protein M0C28_03200 [Candidatus Moduliflexus flocculans]|nr:hypothetical protein [Candidatus Moduliflexus flocculans]